MITVVAFEMEYTDGRGTDDWAYAMHAELFDFVWISRSGGQELLKAAVWTTPLTLFIGSRKEARDSLLDNVVEIAEEVSNLYLATR